MERCTRIRECGHPCVELCYLDCRCICSTDRPQRIQATPSKGLPEGSTSHHARIGSQPVSRHGSPISSLSGKEIEDQIEAFQAFAKGGHVEADKKLVENANKETAVAMDEDAQKKLKQADDEMAAALFADVDLISLEESPHPASSGNVPLKKTEETPKKKADGVELVRTTSDGKRGVWKGTYDPKSEASETKQENKGQVTRLSLLD